MWTVISWNLFVLDGLCFPCFLLAFVSTKSLHKIPGMDMATCSVGLLSVLRVSSKDRAKGGHSSRDPARRGVAAGSING